MKPLFFPFTYVTEPVLTAFNFFFSGITVLQSSVNCFPEHMGHWIDRGGLGVWMPEPKVSQQFDALMAETDHWVRSRRGGVVSFLKGRQDEIPFFGPSSVSQIRQDIRAVEQAVIPDAPRREALMQARLFLQLSQEFDAHNQWLSHQMREQETMERNLYRELGTDERFMDRVSRSSRPMEEEESFQYMIPDRLRAWSRVMLSHGRVPGLLATTCDSVLTLIREHLPDGEKLIPVATIPAIPEDGATAKNERQRLADYCEKLMHTPMPLLKDSGWPDACSADTTDILSMQLFLLPGMAPQRLLYRFVGGKLPDDGEDTLQANTLIGYIYQS
jgi:hypothetical protein